MNSWQVYILKNKETVRLENSGVAAGQLLKTLSERYKLLSKEEKDKLTQFAEDNKLTVAISRQKPSDSKIKARGIISTQRVNSIAHLDGSVKHLAKEASNLIAKATEMFIAFLATETQMVTATSGRRQMIVTDVINCVQSRQVSFVWQKLFFPLLKRPSHSCG